MICSRSWRETRHCSFGVVLTTRRRTTPLAAELFDPPHLRLLEHRRVRLPDLVGDPLDHRLGLLDVGLVGDFDVEQRARPVLAHVADHPDLAVGDVPDDAVDAAQPGGPQADPLDHAADLAFDVDDVADPELVFDQDEHPGEEVLDQRLRAEAERDADHAGAGEQRRQADPDLAEDHEGGDQPDHEGDEAAQDAGQRLDPLFGAQAGFFGLPQRARARRGAPPRPALPSPRSAAGAAPLPIARRASQLISAAPTR